MGRFPQPSNGRGSLKWIQWAVNDLDRPLDRAVLAHLPSATRIEWLSPIAADDFAEYRDADFLDRLGLQRLAGPLAAFWPARGPQWDALGRSDAGQLLLVEAKAHVGEVCSPGSKAGSVSMDRIKASLAATVEALGAEPLAPWETAFYQLANRLAHLQFLRAHGVDAWLVLVNFVGDRDMNGPTGEEAWRAAYDVVWHVMGLPKRHGLSPYIIEVFPPVTG
jgi:hypothetical protein